MPPGRSDRCVFKQGRLRCRNRGTGDPPLCEAHLIVVAETTRPRQPAEVLLESLGNFLSGKPINAEATIGAAKTIFEAWAIGGGVADGYYPPVNGGPGPSWIPGGAWRPSGRGSQAPDPIAAQRRRVEIEARSVLGFGPNEPLTEEAIKDRRRTLAKRNHPDAGGSAKQMAIINDAADVLIESLDGKQ